MEHNTLEHLLADRSFVLWIKGEGSSEDEQYWNSWLSENPECQALADEARALVTAVNSEHPYTMPSPRDELKKLDRAIDRYESRRRYIGSYQPFFWKYRQMVAAGILLLVASLGGFLAYQYYQGEPVGEKATRAAAVQVHHTKYGEKVTYRLSDGSRIILNANSSLRFSSTIEKGLNTEVWLEGEAYFNIAHLEGDGQRTFTVHTSDGSIQVLGTKFVVKTFASETQAVLEEGRIRVQVREVNSDSTHEYILKPGNLARFAEGDNKIAVKEVNTRLYTSWIEDKLFFENTPMEEVARRIEDTFGVKVVVAEELAGQNLTGSVKSTDLEVFSEALSEILKSEIKKQGRTLYIGVGH